VNVSARQLEAPGFAQLVVGTLDRHALPPDRLVIELTETYLAQIGDYVVSELESLAELGVQLAADDFGTGYSPLTRITELPVKIIKIDKQFIDHITTDRRARAIVASLVELASTLGLAIVGEGVETLAQAEVLSDMGCSAAQGHLWSPAVDESEFRALLHSRGRGWPTVVVSTAQRRADRPHVGPAAFEYVHAHFLAAVGRAWSRSDIVGIPFGFAAHDGPIVYLPEHT
jgi:EAL domain-containing protein (putative c-di-GMP-specific phosphodiesterase class I)